MSRVIGRDKKSNIRPICRNILLTSSATLLFTRLHNLYILVIERINSITVTAHCPNTILTDTTMTIANKLNQISEILLDILEDVEHPESMPPKEVTQLFLDYLQGFDADEFEETLHDINEAIKKMVDKMLETTDFEITSPMMRVQIHIECAYEAWKNRPGN